MPEVSYLRTFYTCKVQQGDTSEASLSKTKGNNKILKSPISSSHSHNTATEGTASPNVHSCKHHAIASCKMPGTAWNLAGKQIFPQNKELLYKPGCIAKHNSDPDKAESLCTVLAKFSTFNKAEPSINSTARQTGTELQLNQLQAYCQFTESQNNLFHKILHLHLCIKINIKISPSVYLYCKLNLSFA